MAMKRTTVLSAILLLVTLAASAEPAPARRFSNRLFNDVVQMTRAGLSDATIVAYVKARRARLEADVNADDLIRLRQAGVSESVVGYIAGVEGMNVPSRASGGDVAYDSSGSAETSYGEDEAYSYASIYPYPYWYGWWGYPYWYAYSPFFSGRVFVTGRFGGRRFDHRGFRRGNFSAPSTPFRGGSSRGSGGRGGSSRGSGGRGHR